MFPRLSLFYRLLAICLLVFLVMVVLNNSRPDLTVDRRLPYLKDTQGWSETGDVIPPNDLDQPVGHTTYTATVRTFTVTAPKPTGTEAPVNPHNFSYIINPTGLCNVNDIKYLIYVHSAPKYYKKRQMLRQTWASETVRRKYRMRIVFVMGIVNDSAVMDAVQLESSQYGDLVVEDFLDTYRNLTYKAVAALKWVSKYCDKVTYIIKSDDDILIDIHGLMNYMNSSEVRAYGTKKLIMCNQWLKMKVIRDKRSKWYVSKKEFTEDYFPPYCSGSAFVMSVDVVRAMYEASFSTKFFWVDDFYVTGLLVQKMNVTHRRMNEGYVLNAKVVLEKFKKDTKHELRFFHVGRLTHIYKMWKTLKQIRNVTCTDCSTWSPDTMHVSSNTTKHANVTH